MSSLSSTSLAASASAARKRQELAGLQEMVELSEGLVHYLGEIGEKMETLSQGSSVVAQTVDRWSDVFALMSAHEKERACGRGLVVVPTTQSTQSA